MQARSGRASPTCISKVRRLLLLRWQLPGRRAPWKAAGRLAGFQGHPPLYRRLLHCGQHKLSPTCTYKAGRCEQCAARPPATGHRPPATSCLHLQLMYSTLSKCGSTSSGTPGPSILNPPHHHTTSATQLQWTVQQAERSRDLMVMLACMCSHSASMALKSCSQAGSQACSRWPPMAAGHGCGLW